MDLMSTAQLLGNFGEFVGAIAVVLTLVYLVFQIRQNTRSIRSQSRYYVLEALNLDMKQAQEPRFYEIVGKVSKDEASEIELRQWGLIVAGWLSHLEILFLELADGTLPRAFEDTLRWRLGATFILPKTKEVWENLQGYYTSDFQKYVDELLQKDLDAIVSDKKHY